MIVWYKVTDSTLKLFGRNKTVSDLFCEHCYIFIERLWWTHIASSHTGLSRCASG